MRSSVVGGRSLNLPYSVPSYAKTFVTDSDVDILVAFDDDAHWSLYDWVDMIAELEAIFGREVHLLSKRGLCNPFRRHEILTTREVVYAA